MFKSQKRLLLFIKFLIVCLVLNLICLLIYKHNKIDTHSDAFKIFELNKRLFKRLYENKDISGVDNSGSYRILLCRAASPGNYKDVTLVSQSSANHFGLLDRLFNAWEGPISVAIFTEPEFIRETLWDVAKFMHCHDNRFFSMLVITSMEVLGKKYRDYESLPTYQEEVSCSSLYLSTKKQKRNYNWSSPYPVNLLRNEARKQSFTEYFLVIDIDMVPSLNLRTDFLNFIQAPPTSTILRKLQNAVYVLPVFEILPNVSLPKNKNELRTRVNLNEARPFYVVPCEDCQKATRYNQWLVADSSEGTKILYEVEWRHPYEPFFIAAEYMPYFDERFSQYGMNRVSWVCELYTAGNRFMVMDNIFLFHVGFKTMDDFHSTKEEEMKSNKRIYSQFKNEMIFKYPGSKKVC